MRYLELSHVRQTATREGEKDYVTLEEKGNGIFTESRGEIGVRVGKNKPRSIPKPMSAWEQTVQSYLSRGYRIVPGKVAPAEKKTIHRSENEYEPEETKEAQELVTMLTSLAKKSVQENFASDILVDVPTAEQFQEGSHILSELEKSYETLDVKDFNQLLCNYFSIMPRRMKFLYDNLAHGKDRRGRKLSDAEFILEKANLVAAEKERLEILRSLIVDEQNCKYRRRATEANQISVCGVSKDEEQWIKSLLAEHASNYVRAWKISNRKTEEAFTRFCSNHHLQDPDISHLFHGSRGENFWSIITNGLTINPINVVITGKAYGQGTYFAPDARKSLGYTDRLGSRWANGSAQTGLLGIYKVATGKRYNGSLGTDSSLTWKKLQEICPGAFCTWAESRYSGFIMDEVIVYNDEQSTIEYLVEIGNQ